MYRVQHHTVHWEQHTAQDNMEKGREDGNEKHLLISLSFLLSSFEEQVRAVVCCVVLCVNGE